MIVIACVAAFPPRAGASSLIPTESSIGVDAVGYFQSSAEASRGFQAAVAPRVIGKWNGRYDGNWLEAGGQAAALLMFPNALQQGQKSTSASTYLEVPELYASTVRGDSPLRLSLGRRLQPWSRLDSQWELGIWQPRFRWDYLHPETVGLVGAFVTVERPSFRLLAWGSPIFVPERGVPLDTRDGVISSDSRWFIPPPSRATILERSTPVRYTLGLPPMAELLAQPGAAVLARAGGEAGPWASAGYAYKPMNQLRLAMNGVLDLSEDGSVVADAMIYPRVAYHHLASLEGGWSSEAASAWFSLLKEEPVTAPTSSLWTTQQFVPATAASASVDLRVAGTPEHATRLDLSYIRQWGGNAPDDGPQALADGASHFEARYPFQSAVAVGLRSALHARVTAGTRVLYDIGHEGAVWSAELRYRPRGAWVVGVGADVLSAPEGSSADGSDVISRFRANDRVHAGISYVF